MGFIIRYEVVRIALRYGRDIVLRSYDTFEKAVSEAMLIAKGENRICVFEVRYASRENMEKHFCFDSHIRWAEWL